MEPLPSLAGLSLALEEEEAAPRPTDAAPDSARQHDGNYRIGVEVLKNHSFAFDQKLRNWKNTTGVRERWNRINGREYFEDDSTFFEDWVQASQQECFFYEDFNMYQSGSRVIHPIQHVLRVVTEAFEATGYNAMSPEKMILDNEICIVDGSNMFDVSIGNTDRGHVRRHWANVVGRVQANGKKPDIAIGFVKSQTLKPDVSYGVKPGFRVNGRVINRDYRSVYQMLSELGNWVCLVVVEDWEARGNLEGNCHPDRGLVKSGQHKFCEYDDFLMMGLRDYIDYVKNVQPSKPPSLPQDAPWPELLPAKFGNGFLMQIYNTTPEVMNPTQKNAWHTEWRTNPTMGIVTCDNSMQQIASTEDVKDAFKVFLEYSDVYRIRVFLPLKDTQSTVNSLWRLLYRFQQRYNISEDYVQHPKNDAFYQVMTYYLTSRGVAASRYAQSNSSRIDANESTRVTWEYSTNKDTPCPPGWPVRRKEYADSNTDPRTIYTGQFLIDRGADLLTRWLVYVEDGWRSYGYTLPRPENPWQALQS